MMTKQKKDELVADVLSMNEGELLRVLEAVLQRRKLFEGEGNYLKRRFYLGIATSDPLREFRAELQSEELWTKLKWWPWEFMAVAYPDRTEYPPDVEVFGTYICQYGVCTQCNTELASTLKEAICPLCGKKNSLT